jgi:glycosyltransferase involved in cell wall biosynthesis
MSKIYTWPNKSFPFRLYYNGSGCRIFIIENLSHNYEWLKQVSHNIKSTDYFFIYVGWHIDKHSCIQSDLMFEELGLNKEQFYIMYNTHEEHAWGHDYGFHGDVINHNAWIDENLFTIQPCEKKYDALYIARRTKWKRHHLAGDIKNLAMACGGNNHGNEQCDIPTCANNPDDVYTPEQIVELINSSRCGLSLSEAEGASFGTSEYLLCGVPVVTTPSKGGRNVWLNMDNSIEAQPTKWHVAHSVETIIDKNLSPSKIRQDHIRLTSVYRDKFIKQLQHIFNKYNCPIDAKNYFSENYYHKMRKSTHIDTVLEMFK